MGFSLTFPSIFTYIIGVLKATFKWCKDYVLNAQTDPKDFPKIKDAVARSNQQALHAFSRIAVVMFALALIVFSGLSVDAKMSQNLGYAFGFVTSLIIFFVNKFLVPKYPKLLIWLVYLFNLCLFGFGFILAFVATPNQLTISLLIMFAIVPMFFTVRPPVTIIMYFVLGLIFVHLVALFKPADMRVLEVANMLVYSSVGLILGMYMMRIRLERFIFENRVEELTNQEQMTRYLKSISTIYLCMHHADLKTGLYAEIRSTKDLNQVLNSSLDRDFGRQVVRGIEFSADPDFKDAAIRFVDVSTVAERLKGKRTITHEYLSKKGAWCRARYVNVDYDKKGELPRFVLFAVEDIDEQKRREKELISQAETDAMTGLLNRNGGVSKIKEALHEDKRGLLCLFDVDKFKYVNDNFGHQTGDKVIIAVAEAMRRTFRDGDILLRLGGDEYMVFLNKVITEEQGCLAFGRFFAELSNAVIEGHEDYQISVSLGATFYRGGKVDFNELYQQADSCTYESKKIEGRSFTFFRQK